MMKFEVVIIGAGPAGSITAYTLAKRDVNVLIIEKQRQIGSSVHCAGGIIGSILERLKLIKKLEKYGVIKSNISAIKFIAPDKNMALFKLNRTIGHVVDRSKFDDCLATLAVNKGAILYLNSKFVKINGFNNNNGINIKIRQNNKLITLNTKILVGADGVKSQVANQAGFNVQLKYLGYGYSFDFDNVSNINSNMMEVYFSEKIPGGYSWIFPTGNSSANFGCGGLGKSNFYYKKVFEYFIKKFPDINKKFKFAIKKRFTGGIVPISSPPRSCVKKNILIVGDAANQINSITAEGIRFSLLCGKIAGLVINYALQTNLQFLKNYDRYWRQFLGKEVFFSKILRDFFFRFNNDDYNTIIKAVSKLNFNDIMVSYWSKVIRDIALKTPSSIKLIRAKFRHVNYQ
ncbi:MAG: geranylgeranyl reductase family protein [Candidatus Helarchaeota archaeon]